MQLLGEVVHLAVDGLAQIRLQGRLGKRREAHGVHQPALVEGDGTVDLFGDLPAADGADGAEGHGVRTGERDIRKQDLVLFRRAAAVKEGVRDVQGE